MSPKISLNRPILSYSKVQKLVGNLIRNRRFQIRWNYARIKNLEYLDVGCGPNTHDNFINLEYIWHPKIDVCWDITRGLPFKDGSMRGIFTEHCLEHFPLPVAFKIMCELRRILSRGGILRLVVPDGELYLNIYSKQTSGDHRVMFPYQDNESFNGIASPILSVNRIFYQDRESLFGHRIIYDADLLTKLLGAAGFGSIERMSFQNSRDTALAIDTPSRACESLYMEACAL